MKFFCLLPVRDEADIIGQCLDRLLTWADRIFIFDTGSVDHTWEIVQEYAARSKKIEAVKKDAVYFSETKLRGFLFHKARQEMKDGDWFLRVDADEFHYLAPEQFIKERLRKHETIVYHQYYNFELTQSEANRLSSYEAIVAERELPITDRRRNYTISVYSEPRLCKYRSTMKWPDIVSFPYNAGFLAKERLPILHYPNRDPLQMDRRCKLRAVMLANKENRLNWGDPDSHHWTIDDWKKFVVPDQQEGMKRWELNTPLPEIKQYNHLAPFYKRAVQRLVHSTLLDVLDKTRPSFSDNVYPQKINPEKVSVLQDVLSNTEANFK